jgi:hypothetical protein
MDKNNGQKKFKSNGVLIFSKTLFVLSLKIKLKIMASSMSVLDADMSGLSNNPPTKRIETIRRALKKYRDKNSKTALFKIRKSLQNKKSYQGKKKRDAELLMIENGGFKSRDGLLKKTRQLQEHLPNNPIRAAQVVNELSKKHPLTQINANQAEKKKTPSENEKKVTAFYENEENVVILPGSNDFVVRKDENNKKVKMQKHILKDSTRNMFKKFKVRKLSCKMKSFKSFFFFFLNSFF